MFRGEAGPIAMWVCALVVAAVSATGAEPPATQPSDPWQATDPLIRIMNRGVAFMERYEYGAAVAAFEEALQRAPDSLEVRLNLALARFNRAGPEDMEQAASLIAEILSREPEHLHALYFRGVMLQHAGSYDEAAPCFERVVQLDPHDAYAWYMLARCRSQLDQPCRRELERAVQENPALASAYYNLMRACIEEGDEENARRYQQLFTVLRAAPLAENVVIPQYRQMGPLSLVLPPAGRPTRPVAGGEISLAGKRILHRWPRVPSPDGAPQREPGLAAFDTRIDAQFALADVNGDHRPDVLMTLGADGKAGGLTLQLGTPEGPYRDATAVSGLQDVTHAVACAFGDYDNDGFVDLYISRDGPNRLFRGAGDGTFQDVTGKTGTAGPDVRTTSGVFLDADHDGDLDLFVCHAGPRDEHGPGTVQLLNNNLDGTFTDITAGAGLDAGGRAAVMLAPADLDADRDTDLVVAHVDRPPSVFVNDRGGQYHSLALPDAAVSSDGGVVVQDLSGDGRMDLLIWPTPAHRGRLYLSDAAGRLAPSPQWDDALAATADWPDARWGRLADVDLDGDLDVLVGGAALRVLLNDGWGRFQVLPRALSLGDDATAVRGWSTADLTGDGVVDLLVVAGAEQPSLELHPLALQPPANWLSVMPTGLHGADKATRSPASGFGTRLDLRTGLHSQTCVHTGLSGGPSQSCLPLVFGLNGVTQADYMLLTWPDGVTQSEPALPAGVHHRIEETQRKISSCPVLFAWNGERFEFIGDFAGVGGLGYYLAPGRYAQPQPRELIRIAPHQLRPRDGYYELRVCEPMEEVAYVDHLELLVVDHDPQAEIIPDERLAVGGPPPTQDLLVVEEPIYPVAAHGPDGAECAARLRDADRDYAYLPRTDRRFYGFAAPHELTLDFADAASRLERDRAVYLFVQGSIEFPYSQTTFAAGQARTSWSPLRIDQQQPDGAWETLVPDAGAPGGINRIVAVNLTGRLRTDACRLRIHTNLEIFYDRIFLAADRGTGGLTVRTAPPAGAELRRLGFPLEHSPDGRPPTVYSYDVIEPNSALKRPRGHYTRYGPVEELLRAVDDRLVILGTGDELAVRFDARALPPPPEGTVRRFILRSHAWCKDMDLYTGEPDTVEPLPFAGMSSYPPPEGERSLHEEQTRRDGQTYHTRRVE